MGALDAIKAKLAAQKAATTSTPSSDATPAPTPSAPQHDTGTAEVVGQPQNVATSGASEPLAGAGAVDPRLSGLSGIQLLLARKKLAEASAKSGAGARPNTSAGSHSGVISGTGSSIATESSKVQLAQGVLTPAQRAMEEAKSILQRKEGEGFYNIPADHASKLPQDLPADVVSERLRELDAALVLRTPDLARLTIEINRNLRQYDELAYLLHDNQLGLIVQANLAIKNTELIQTKAKGASVAKRNEKIAASLTADDI